MAVIRRAKVETTKELECSYITIACYKCRNLREYRTVSRHFLTKSQPWCRYCSRQLEIVERIVNNKVLIVNKRAKQIFGELLCKWRER